jgi:CDP-glucose 4,6-dehydratase
MEKMVTFKELQKVYKGKKVFLTGHTGFKGSWMLQTLNLLGAEVMGYALAPQTSNDLYTVIDGDKLCESIIADIREKQLLENKILAFQPDYIFHLAAQPLVRLSYEIPSETYEVNAIGSAYVLDSIRKLEKKCSVVMITTDKVYHNNEWVYPYRENDRLGGFDPYSASKACAELIIDSYRNSFFNINNIVKHQKGIAVARAGNVIGGGDWSKDRLIPDIVRSLIENKTIIIRNPRSIRPWQHVMEPIIGYLMLGMKLSENPQSFSESFNFGPNPEDNLSVEDLVKLAINEWGAGDYQVEHQINAPHEAGLLMLDISKVKEKLEWKPSIDSLKSIKLTIEFYKNFSGNVESSKTLKDQINSFIK